MVVKNQIKLIRSLQQKKYRNQHGLFFVEGKKNVQALLDSDFEPYSVFSTEGSLSTISDTILTEITLAKLKQMSALKNPNGVLGVFHMPKPKEVDFDDWIVVLDDIQDPGNLGTLIRLCDWFGIKNLICSPKTVDCYNPKVLQAAMGSIARVNITSIDLVDFLEDVTLPIYGAFMNGISVYESNLPEKGILVLGNEGNGISKEIENIISLKITIPQYGKLTAESLNVATAGSILLNEIRRS